MIHISNATTIDGQTIDLQHAGNLHLHINAHGLTVFPGLIDPHVHFRIPGMEYKEDWRTAAKAAIRGGYTTVFDMPNTLPPTTTQKLLQEKKAIIDAQLHEIGIPLRYALFFGADKKHLAEIAPVKNEVIGIKVFMGCSTGNLVIDDDESLQAVFEIAAQQDMLVAVHAEDEALMNAQKSKFAGSKRYADHSLIRNEEVAAKAVEKAISLTKRYGTRLYILHASTADELALIAQAKKAGLPVYAETTPHHLFLSDKSYEKLHGKAVVNPPLRSELHQHVVWENILSGVIDTIGSDHAPHTIAEKAKPYGECPSGMPGIETTLPLLLNAYHEGKISLERIIELTVTKAREIFRLPSNDDIVLVDLEKTSEVKNEKLQTKCGWSSFEGMRLRGWPVYTIMNGHCFELRSL